MNITECLANIATFFAHSRRVGHTTLMLEGVKNFTGTVVVLASDERHAARLRREIPDKKIVSILSSEKLIGEVAAAAIDNHTVSVIAGEALSRINELEQCLAEERRRTARYLQLWSEERAIRGKFQEAARKLLKVMEHWRLTDWFRRRETGDPIGEIVVGINGDEAISAIAEADELEGSMLEVEPFTRKSQRHGI